MWLRNASDLSLSSSIVSRLNTSSVARVSALTVHSQLPWGAAST